MVHILDDKNCNEKCRNGSFLSFIRKQSLPAKLYTMIQP